MKMQQTNEHHPNSTTQSMQQEGGMVRQTLNGNSISLIFYIYVTSSQSFRKCLSQFSGAAEGQAK